MRVTMELNDGEMLRCDKCKNLFYDSGFLDIDDGDLSVEAVYCTPCTTQTSDTSMKTEET